MWLFRFIAVDDVASALDSAYDAFRKHWKAKLVQWVTEAPD